MLFRSLQSQRVTECSLGTTGRRLAGGGPADREIGHPGAPVRSFVVAAREDIQIAAQVRAVLAAGVH